MLNQHKLRLAQSFGKAALCYTQHNRLQQQCAERLLAKLPPTLGRVLDGGCGPAVNTATLAERSRAYVGFDLSEGMLAAAKAEFPAMTWVQGDLEQLPFADDSFDHIFINLALQWSSDLHTTLTQLMRCLKPQGRLVFSTVLDGSMAPLGTVFKAVTGHARHNSFCALGHLQNVVRHVSGRGVVKGVENGSVKAGVQTAKLAIPYLNLRDMLHDLKGIGANYQPAGHQPLTRAQLAATEDALENYREDDGKLYLHWHVAFVEITK